MTYILTARRMAASLMTLAMAGTLTTLGAPTASAAPPLDASPAICQRDGGVYVYAQYDRGGDFVARGCTPAGETGYQHLRRLTSIQLKGGALCRIGGIPDICKFDSSTVIYWSYWQWTGTSWYYSQEGGGTYTGAPGSIEAWQWGEGDPPPFTPPAPAQAPKPPAPPKPPATKNPAGGPQAPVRKPSAPAKSSVTKPSAVGSVSRRPATQPPPASGKSELTASRRPSPQTPANSAPTSSDAPTTVRPSFPAAPTTPPSTASTPTTAEPTTSGVAYVVDDSSGGPWATIGTTGFLAVAGAGYGVFRATKKRRV